jgi:hypothetical protein
VADPIVLTFRVPPTRDRLRHYLLGLFGIRGAVFLLAALVPAAIFPGWGAAIGPGLFVFGVGAGALSVLVTNTSDFVLELDVDGVRETRDGKVLQHDRDWVVRVERRQNKILLYVRAESMRSFRLSTSVPRVLTIDEEATSPETVARLERMFANRTS